MEKIPRPLPSKSGRKLIDPASHLWKIFINCDGVQRGPSSLQDIQYLLDNKEINTKSTKAWYQGLPQWIPVDEIPGIQIPSFIDKRQEFISTSPPSLNGVDLNKVIDGISISEGKKRLFKLIASTPLKSANGIPVFDTHDKRLKPFRITFTEKDCLGNGWAFLFQWFYWFAKGMWRKGILLAVIQITLSIIAGAILGPKVQLAVGISFSLLCSAMASYDLYRKLVLKEEFWW